VACRIIVSDVLDGLATLADSSVQCVVTSPPYWGLRDYGTASWEGGAADCDHAPPDEAGASVKPSAGQRQHAGRFSGPTCWKCGATRRDRQIGLERTPAEYLARMVQVFREVHRVMREDGTLWLNLGDCYNAFNGGAGPGSGEVDGPSERSEQRPALPSGYGLRDPSLKPKDMIGIPWRVALALQADGWWLRSDIVWAKPNPMPESVTDRPTKAHEYLFLMARSARYYYDAEAISEACVTEAAAVDVLSHQAGTKDERRERARARGKLSVAGSPDGQKRIIDHVADARANGAPHDSPFGVTRNKRTVWTVGTEAFPEAHFATFPTALVEPCILAGSRRGDLVLDPFAGAGTVGLVADRLGRDFIGVELNPAYAAMAERRIRGDSPLFAEVEVVPNG
jgi:DNA modification methylase